jgi:hypothetical protein
VVWDLKPQASIAATVPEAGSFSEKLYLTSFHALRASRACAAPPVLWSRRNSSVAPDHARAHPTPLAACD